MCKSDYNDDWIKKYYYEDEGWDSVDTTKPSYSFIEPSEQQLLKDISAKLDKIIELLEEK